MKLIVIGGGAAGCFAALAAKSANAAIEVILLEKSAKLLSKVRISGGGRCNVTHGCFDPSLLVQNYPRGSKELIGPFHTFQPRDTVEWFGSRGVELKIESDGRMFPCTDSSSTIIDCLMGEMHRLGVEIQPRQRIVEIKRSEGGFRCSLASGEELISDCLLLATGSSQEGFDFARALGHTIHKPVPSLFTFNVPAFPLTDLAGISVEKVTLSLENLKQQGPLLITHWGFSGPAALKLSAWGARKLYEKDYKVALHLDWLPDVSEEQIREIIQKQQKKWPLPKKLWKRLLELSGIDPQARLSSIGKVLTAKLCERLKCDCYTVCGKTTHKEEFVTCGGVTLSEIDFRRMESRLCKGLFFAGEILDIDGITGGFNFQSAWTTGWIAGNAAAAGIQID